MGDKRKMKYTSEEIRYRLSDLGVQIGNIAIEYIAELEKENSELKDKLNNLSKVAEVRLANWQKYEKENAELKTQAKKIILKLYNVGRDVLMCRADEAAYDNLSTAINDRSIEQFLKENNNEQARN